MPSNFLRMYLAVSLKCSKRRTGGTAGRNPHGRTTPHSREGRNLLAEYRSWQRPSPIRDPLTQDVENIPTCPRSLNSGPGMLFENWATWLV
jgi:hypothetical protein